MPEIPYNKQQPLQSFETGTIEGFQPLSVIVNGRYVNEAGEVFKIRQRDVRDYVQEVMNRVEPTDARTATRVVGALHTLMRSTPNSPGEGALVSHMEASPFLTAPLPKQLSERERRILDMRSGDATGTALTLKQVGAELGVTQGRIRQIEQRALSKLRLNERAGTPGRYDALTFLRYPKEEMARKLPKRTAENLGTFLLAASLQSTSKD